jgi:hypothetical protein
MLRAFVPAVLLIVTAALPIETLNSVAALPAHLAGRLEEMTACEQARDGRYFIFDRRSHTVFAVPPSRDQIQRIIEIGAEKGRVLRPTAFDLADDETFVIADAPGGLGRVQVFHLTGASLGGFTIAGRESNVVAIDGVVLSGIGSLEYTGRSVFMSRPEHGALVSEYALDGRVIRTFGLLRQTGHDDDPQVHFALNSGLVVVNPQGGFYFVFAAGVPLFRKYDARGKLLFERHVEGVEIDEYVQSIPTKWPRQKSADGGELPLVRPGIRAAAADREGNLWISLTTPFTYVYDGSGDKRRTVQFRGAGIVSPTALTFTSKGQVLVTPGCYTF